MNNFVKGLGLSLLLSGMALAAPRMTSPQNVDYRNFQLPKIEEASFEDAGFIREKKEWSRQKRKLASEMSFSGADVSEDFQRLRDEWLKCKSGDEMEALLKKSHASYESFSQDTKYFLAQMHTALPFRGIIWRVRPLFENSKGFLGNKSTHVAAVQAVRTSVTALKMMIPTKQTDAAIQYFTEPSSDMSKADQFKSVTEFQNFLVERFIPALKEAITRINSLSAASAQKPYVWDHKMGFGRGTFEDDIQRYVGNGPAEVNFVIASLYRAYHDVLVYCAYNQDHAIKLAGELGSHLGVDSSIFGSKKGDLGLSDQERVGMIRSAASGHDFLQLKVYGQLPYGQQLLKDAYVALKNSVVFADRAYQYLQGRDATKAMGLNPVLFQQDVAPNLEKGIANMKAVVQGPAEVRDPVTGDTVSVNLLAFYRQPPASLSALLPTGFEAGEIHKTLVNKKGEKLQVRNYLHGRSIAWDNEAWKKYVPSAEGKAPGYMAEARRVISYSFGTSLVFGLPELFVH